MREPARVQTTVGDESAMKLAYKYQNGYFADNVF